jgi:pimeloyl-ACP methyl ester carboxylesterase
MLSSLATILVVVAVVFPLTVWLLQERLIFFQQPLSEAQRGAVRQRFPAVREVFLQSGSEKIHAWHVPAAPGAPLVLYFGGNAEEVSWMISQAATRAPGIGWLLVNYRGYGASEGSPSEATISADALQWHDYAVKELKPGRVLVFGRSIGSGPAVLVASERPIAGAVLVTPFDSLVEVAKRHYPFLPVSIMLRHQFDSIGRAPRISAPLLCLAATRDEIIPASHARKLFDAWAGPKRWVALEEAGHNTTDSHPLFWQNVTEFLVKPPS